MTRPELSKRMRTKNPFCTGTELAALRAIKLHPQMRVTDMARRIGMSPDTFTHALTGLLRAGHIKRSAYREYQLAITGKYLLECAMRIERAAR